MKNILSHQSSTCMTCGAAVNAATSSWIALDLTAVPTRYRKTFEEAAGRFNTIIASTPRSVNINGVVKPVGINISAKVGPIDGIGGTLGQAGPTAVLNSDGLPVSGIMEFDVADIANMESNGTLDDVILHEMAHCLGVGTLWTTAGLVRNSGTPDPVFIGTNAVAEYRTLSSNPLVNGIPLANTGGPGTREGHWRERTFGDELFTGYISGNVRPLSRMSIASLRDLGYDVNFAGADPYTLPSPGTHLRRLAAHVPAECVRPNYVTIDDDGAEGIVIDVAA